MTEKKRRFRMEIDASAANKMFVHDLVNAAADTIQSVTFGPICNQVFPDFRCVLLRLQTGQNVGQHDFADKLL